MLIVNDCRFRTPVALTGRAGINGMLFLGLGHWEAEAKLPLLSTVILHLVPVLLRHLQVSVHEHSINFISTNYTLHVCQQARSQDF